MGVALLLLLAVGGLLVWRGQARHAGSADGPTLKIGDQRGGAQALLRAAGELDDAPYTIEFARFFNQKGNDCYRSNCYQAFRSR